MIYQKHSIIRIAPLLIMALLLILSCSNENNQSASISCTATWLNGGSQNIPKSEYSDAKYLRCGDTAIFIYKDSSGPCMISINVYHANPGPYDSLLGVKIDSTFFSNSPNEKSFYKTNALQYWKIDGGTKKGAERRTQLNSYCKGI